MKVRRQIMLDRYLGLPLGYMLNVMVRLLGKLLRINHKLDREFERIAVVKFKGMGSIIQSSPLMQTLKKNYPNAQLTIVTSIQNKEIVEALNNSDEAIYLKDGSFFSLISNVPFFLLRLISKRFQLLFDLEVYSNLSSIISTLTCATNRFGYFLSSGQYRMGLYTHMMYFNTRMPLSMTYLQMARELPLSDIVEEMKKIETAKSDIGQLQSPYILINPNASELRVERRWPMDKFACLIDEFQERYKEHQLVLVGSETESTYVKQICDLLRNGPSSVLDLSGKTSIAHLISLISNTELFISCDTGPAHLAYNQGCKTVVLFGPVNPIQFRIPENVRVIYKNLYCSPCVHEFDVPPCLGDNQCMKAISVDEVLKAGEELLNGENKMKAEPVRYTSSDGKALGSVNR